MSNKNEAGPMKEKSCLGRAEKSFKKIDVYGEKIQLTY